MHLKLIMWPILNHTIAFMMGMVFCRGEVEPMSWVCILVSHQHTV